jgi:multiple sugar transport system permease protein
VRPVIAETASVVSPPRERVKRAKLFDREAPLGYALVIPAVLYLGIFIAYPFLMSIYMSFTDAQAGNQKWAWTGWANYSKVEAYDVLANGFHIAQFKEKKDAEAFAAQRDKGTVTAEPSEGGKFKGVLHVAGKDIAVVQLKNDGDASFAAQTILSDFDWAVRKSGTTWDIVASSKDPLTLGEFQDRKAMKDAVKSEVLVEADTTVQEKGTGVLQDPNFIGALKNTFEYTFLTELIKLFIGVPCALLLNRKFPGRRILRGLVVIPWVIPIAISAQGWLWIFDSTYGVINWFLTHAHLVAPGNVPNFRGDKNWAMFSLCLVNVWRGFPFTAIIILAGLTSIPDEIIERARLDGANALQRFVHIIAPMVRPILMVSLLFSVIFSFTDFNTIWIITRGGPYDQTQVLATYAYQLGINAGYLGKGAAVSLFMFPIMAVMVLAILQFLRREV